jgi:ribose/xylose/arabinose/galactoside ABC-type transport system permease subunit
LDKNLLLQKLSQKRKLVQLSIIIFIFVLEIITISILSDKFLTVQNFYNVGTQVTMIITVGTVINLLMISGSIDLSIGSVIGFSGVTYAKFAVMGVPLVLSALLTIILAGGFTGILNGIMVTRLKVTPVVATLGMFYMARGLAYVVCGGIPVTLGLPKGFRALGSTFIGSSKFPLIILIGIAFILIFYFIQQYTLLGRYTYAIGGNRNAAKLSGVNPENVTLLLFILVGMITAFGGVMQASRLGTGQPTAGLGFEFDVIIAVVLGGTSLAGGEGNILGMAIGALIVGFLSNGLNLLGIFPFYQYLFKGGVLLIAIVINNFIIAGFERKL